MLNLNRLNCSFPYFVSKENQTLYVIVPMGNAAVFKQPPKICYKVENFSPEEEILPDFLCKVCSSRILTYSEFKAHQQDHGKIEEGIDTKSYFPGAVGVQGSENMTSQLKLNLSEDFKVDSIIDNSTCGSYLDSTTQNIKLEHSKVSPSEITPKEIIKSVCFKSQKPLKNETIKLIEHTRPNLLKRSLNQTLNKWDVKGYAFKMNTNLSSIKDNFEVKSALSNSLLNSKLLSSSISRKGNINFPTVVSSTSNTVPLTNNDFKEPLTPLKKKKTDPKTKSHSYSSSCQRQDQLLKLKKNIDLQESFNLKTVDNHSAEKLNGSSKTSLSRTTDNGDCSILNLKASKYKERDKLNVNKSLRYKQSFPNDDFPNVLSREGTNQTINKFDDSISTIQLFDNESCSDLSIRSECATDANNNGRNKSEYCYDISSSKTSTLNSVKANDRGVYFLETFSKSKEKSLRCFYCRKFFESRFHMKKHLLQHEETNTVFCVLCNCFFTRVSTFREHFLVFHCQAKDERECPYCNYRCFCISNLENHIAKRHSRGFICESGNYLRKSATMNENE